jgi:hypothetical protein
LVGTDCIGSCKSNYQYHRGNLFEEETLDRYNDK